MLYSCVVYAFVKVSSPAGRLVLLWVPCLSVVDFSPLSKNDPLARAKSERRAAAAGAGAGGDGGEESGGVGSARGEGGSARAEGGSVGGVRAASPSMVMANKALEAKDLGLDVYTRNVALIEELVVNG